MDCTTAGCSSARPLEHCEQGERSIPRPRQPRVETSSQDLVAQWPRRGPAPRPPNSCACPQSEAAQIARDGLARGTALPGSSTCPAPGPSCGSVGLPAQNTRQSPFAVGVARLECESEEPVEGLSASPRSTPTHGQVELRGGCPAAGRAQLLCKRASAPSGRYTPQTHPLASQPITSRRRMTLGFSTREVAQRPKLAYSVASFSDRVEAATRRTGTDARSLRGEIPRPGNTPRRTVPVDRVLQPQADQRHNGRREIEDGGRASLGAQVSRARRRPRTLRRSCARTPPYFGFSERTTRKPAHPLSSSELTISVQHRVVGATHPLYPSTRSTDA